MWKVTVRHELGFEYELEFETQPTGTALHAAMEAAAGPVIADRTIPFTNGQALGELCKITNELDGAGTLDAGEIPMEESWTGHDTYIGDVVVEEV